MKPEANPEANPNYVDAPYEALELSIGDIVTIPLKNRWGIDCAATIEAVHADTVDATVWNLDGPGADRFVTGIPLSECTPSRNQ